MKVVTAIVHLKASRNGRDIFGESPTVYMTLEPSVYAKLATATGRVVMKDFRGKPFMVDIDECASIHCGPERDPDPLVDEGKRSA